METRTQRGSNRLYSLIFIAAVFLASAAVIYAGINFQSPDNNVNWGTLSYSENGWYYLDNDGNQQSIESMPTSVNLADVQHRDGFVVINYELPSELSDEAAVYFSTSQQAVKVYIDGAEIYSFGFSDNTPAGRTLGNSRNIVDLPDGAQGKLLSIGLSAPYSLAPSVDLPQIGIGTKGSIVRSIVGECAGVTIFCILAFIASALIFLGALIVRKHDLQFELRGFLHLGFLLALCGVWIITDSGVSLFFIHNRLLNYFASFFSFMLLPVPVFLFMRENFERRKSIFSALTIAFITNMLVQGALCFTGIAPLEQTLPATHLLIVVAIVTILVYCIRERFVYRNPRAGYAIVGMTALIISALLELIAFYASPHSDNSFILRIGLVIFFIALFVGIVDISADTMRKGLKSRLYRELAYMDPTTGIANRMAFERFIAATTENSFGSKITLIIFDINDLKYTNDHFGHLTGDEAIKNAAHCLRETFEPAGRCFRIGGDEFCVLLKNCTDAHLNFLLSKFKRITDEVGSNPPLSIAYGSASDVLEDSDTIRRLFEEADSVMYLQKGTRRSRTRI